MCMKKFKKIWKDVSLTLESIDLFYEQLSYNLNDKDAKRMFDLRGYFQRGIFEGAFEKNNLEKKYYSEALIYCYKQYIISGKMDISKEKIDQWAMECYSATEDGLKYDDILKKMYVKIINSGKKTYKEGAGGLCVDAMLKIWKDKSIQIESPIKKNVKNFFQKLF